MYFDITNTSCMVKLRHSNMLAIASKGIMRFYVGHNNVKNYQYFFVYVFVENHMNQCVNIILFYICVPNLLYDSQVSCLLRA